MRFFLSSLSMNNSARKLCHKSISQIVDQLYWQSSREILSTGLKALRWYDIFKDEKNYSARKISSKEKPGCLSPQSPHPSSFPSMNQNNKARRWWSHAIHGRCLPFFDIFPFFGRIVLTLIRDPLLSYQIGICLPLGRPPAYMLTWGNLLAWFPYDLLRI